MDTQRMKMLKEERGAQVVKELDKVEDESGKTCRFKKTVLLHLIPT